MKVLFRLSICSIVALSALLTQAHQAQRPMLSQAAVTTQRIGLTDVTVTYHRPGVKGRKLWGGLVPYNEVWRAGANEATTITFSDDVRVNGRPLKAGTYSFFIRPGKKVWQVIFNSNARQWGTFFLDKSKNVLSFPVEPKKIPHEEWLLYTFTDLTMNSATLEMRWGERAIGFTIETETDRKLAEANRDAVRFAADQLMGAAETYLEHHTQLDRALNLIDQSIAIRASFENTEAKARILGEMKRYREAIEAAEKALDLQEIERNAYTNMEAYQLRQLMKGWQENLDRGQAADGGNSQ